MAIRDARRDDFAAILTLNAESVHFLSPLSPERLDALHRAAAYHRVVDADGEIAAFLLAFREGAAYDSLNYLWFGKHYPAFLYIDRIVVAPSLRGGGLGVELYADIAAFAARSGVPWLTCEFDLEPPNPGSMRFHERMGFREVGTQWIHGATKHVSLQAKAIATAAAG